MMNHFRCRFNAPLFPAVTLFAVFALAPLIRGRIVSGFIAPPNVLTVFPTVTSCEPIPAYRAIHRIAFDTVLLQPLKQVIDTAHIERFRQFGKPPRPVTLADFLGFLTLPRRFVAAIDKLTAKAKSPGVVSPKSAAIRRALIKAAKQLS